MEISNFKDIHNKTQLEALKNEIKGNLFEFLVAGQIANKTGLLKEFHSNLDASLLKMMKDYESWLRAHSRDLLTKLPVLATRTSAEILEVVSDDIKNVTVVGKLTDKLIKDQLHEADIVLLGESENLYPISLKLVKTGANVTTKSAGAKSFFSKYFRKFENIEFKQHNINSLVDSEFQSFAQSLYERHSLEFSGRFDSQWTLGNLPGELEGDDHDDLLQMYQEIIKHYHRVLRELLTQDRELFLKSILPLIGLGDTRVIQATCFYKAGNYDFVSSKVVNYTNIYDVEVCDLSAGISSFNVRLNKDLLQIRIKPMNRFTNSSFKINCSMKYYKDKNV